MTRLPRTLLLVVRVAAAAALLVGAVVWSGRPAPWRGVHVALGLALAAAFLALGALSARRTGRAAGLLVAAAWTALLVGYGLAHARLWPGEAHWLAQALHVLTGLATLGIAGRLAADARPAAG